jgi:hypothetical protein
MSFGVVFQVGGESKRAFFAFFTTPPKGHGRFAGFGMGDVPKRPAELVCRRAPKRHKVRQSKLSSQVQVFLKGSD